MLASFGIRIEKRHALVCSLHTKIHIQKYLPHCRSVMKGNPRQKRSKQDGQCTSNGRLRGVSWCCGNIISITYSECVFLALGIQLAIRMRHVVICGLSGCTIFFYVISQTARFSGGGEVIRHKCVFWFPLQHLSEAFLILRRIEQDI